MIYIATPLMQVKTLLEDLGDAEDKLDLVDMDRLQDQKLKSRLKRAADDLAELLEEALSLEDDESDSDEDDEA